MSNNIDIKIKATTEGVSEVRKLEQELAALGKIDAFKKLKKDVDSSKQSWVAAQAEAAKLAKEIAAVETPTKTLSKQFDAAKKQAAKLKVEFQANQTALHKLRTSLTNSGVDTKNLSDEQKRLKTSLDGTRKSLSELSKIELSKNLLDVKPYKQVEQEIKNLEQAYETLRTSGKLSAKELSSAYTTLKQKTAKLRSETEQYSDSLNRAKQLSSGLKAALSVAAIGAIALAFKEVTASLFEAGTKVQALKPGIQDDL